jgi:hypothetical protein
VDVPDKPRMSSDDIDKFRRRRCLVWWCLCSAQIVEQYLSEDTIAWKSSNCITTSCCEERHQRFLQWRGKNC